MDKLLPSITTMHTHMLIKMDVEDIKLLGIKLSMHLLVLKI
jgi:hypothetical protein